MGSAGAMSVGSADRYYQKKFKDISIAYDCLGDKEKRKLYDEFGEEGLHAGFDADKARQAAVAYAAGKTALASGDATSFVARVEAYAEFGVVAHLGACEDGWCRIKAGAEEGWVEMTHLWGVEPGEKRD